MEMSVPVPPTYTSGRPLPAEPEPPELVDPAEALAPPCAVEPACAAPPPWAVEPPCVAPELLGAPAVLASPELPPTGTWLGGPEVEAEPQPLHQTLLQTTKTAPNWRATRIGMRGIIGQNGPRCRGKLHLFECT